MFRRRPPPCVCCRRRTDDCERRRRHRPQPAPATSCVAIGGQVPRLGPSHFREEPAFIAHALAAAVLGDLLSVRRHGHLDSDPNPVAIGEARDLHSASSRSARLRRAITSRVDRHLRFEVRLWGTDSSIPCCGFGNRQVFRRPRRLEMRQQLAGGRTTPAELPILGDLEYCVFIRAL